MEWVVMVLSWSGGWRMEEGFEHVCKFQRQNQKVNKRFKMRHRGDNSKTQVQRDGRQWGWAYGWRQEDWMVARLLPCENVGSQRGKGSMKRWAETHESKELRVFESNSSYNSPGVSSVHTVSLVRGMLRRKREKEELAWALGAAKRQGNSYEIKYFTQHEML